MAQNKDCLVIGCGLSGSVIARFLAEKLNKADLAKKLNISYTNFTAMLKQKKVYFKPAKHFTASKVKKESPDMTKTHNEKGQLILTDKLMKKEYCIMQEA